ncbi:MAG: MFS transporter [TACK group archaeon]|nr:MFS transporter [TACK group archaeon]
MNRALLIYSAKASRVFVFGMMTIAVPIYMAKLGYGAFMVGIAIFLVMIGNAVSNIFLTWYGNVFGRKRSLLAFSLLMAVSGILLFSSELLPAILIALFIGNISTNSTETGPFQSVESGVLPSLVGNKERAFGVYNFIGYATSALGSLAASIPAYFADSPLVFRLLFLLYGAVGILLFLIYLGLSGIESSSKKPGLQAMESKSKGDLWKLSFLFSMDAFGGGFVTQSLLSYWFYFTYHVSLKLLGPIFMVVNIITAVSIIASGYIAHRVGNLRTMFYSHLLSNVFLIMIPLSGFLSGALAFLFLRQSVSQMDVPARQALMADLFSSDDRVSAVAITNTARTISALPGSPITGALLAAGLVTVPIVIGGASKIVYDFSIFGAYRKRVRRGL